MNKNKFYQFTAAAQDAPARLDLFGSVGGAFGIRVSMSRVSRPTWL